MAILSGREPLFEVIRRSDGVPMSCELLFHGAGYGWEARFFKQGEVLFSRGGFLSRAQAVQAAEEERRALRE